MLAATASNGKALWYLTRGTGLVSMVLLSLSVGLGVVEVNRWTSPRWPRFVTAALHKNVSLLATAFLAVHIVTSVVDAFAPIHWLDVVIPFVSAYRPIWLGLGAVATDLLIAIIITSLLRQRIGHRLWRVVHWAAYACWPVAVVHGLGTGSDTRHGWALWVYAACFAVVAGCVWWRLASGWTAGNAARRIVGAVGSVVVPTAMVLFVVVGPLRPGWAARAGTPKALIASGRSASPSSPAPAASPGGGPAPVAGGFAGSFRDQIVGRISQDGPNAAGQTTVTISGSLTGQVAGVFRISLVGVADPSGGIAMSTSAAAVGPPSQPKLYQGVVSALSGDQLNLTVHDASGRSLVLAVGLRIQSDGTVVGTFRSAT